MALLDGGKVAATRFKHELPNYGVFDEPRVFQPGPLPEPIIFHGTMIGVPICEDIWHPQRVPAPGRFRRGTAAVSQWQPVRDRQGCAAHRWRGQAPRGRYRIAAGLSQSRRRAGRTGVRRGQLRRQRRRQPSGADEGLGRGTGPDPVDQDRAGLALRPRRDRATGRPARGCLLCHGPGAARLCQPQRLSRRGPGLVRRDRFGRMRRDRGRCPGCGQGVVRDAAQPLHQSRKPGGCPGLRARAGVPLRHHSDRPGGRRLCRHAGASVCRPCP